MQVTTAGTRDCGALVPHQRLVDAGAVHVAPLHRARSVVFRDQPVAVVHEPRRDPGARDLIQPPQRIVGQRGRLGPARAREAVFGVVAERSGSVRGEVAIVIPGQRRRGIPGDLRVLVAAVGGVGTVRATDRELVRVVRLRAGDDLARRVVVERGRQIVAGGRAVQVVDDGAEPRDGVVAEPGGRPGRVAADRIAAPLRVVGQARQWRRGAVLRDLRESILLYLLLRS